MALSRSVLATGSVGNTSPGSSHDGTISCGTVTSGAILIVACGGTTHEAGTATVWSVPTKSSGTGTIGTAVEIGNAGSASNYTSNVRVWQIPVTGAGTLTLSYGDAVSSYGCGIIVVQYTGQDGTTPIVGAVTDVETGSTSFSPTSATLGATPVAADEAVMFADWDTDAGSGKGGTAGSGFTTLANAGTTSDYVQLYGQYRTGSTSTSATWPTQDGSPSSYSAAGVGFIVKAAAGGGSTTDAYVGSVDFAKMYVGSTEITAAYVGSVQFWDTA